MLYSKRSKGRDGTYQVGGEVVQEGHEEETVELHRYGA